MGNLEKAGIIVVTLLLGVILVVAFVSDPAEETPEGPAGPTTTPSELTAEAQRNLAAHRDTGTADPDPGATGSRVMEVVRGNDPARSEAPSTGSERRTSPPPSEGEARRRDVREVATNGPGSGARGAVEGPGNSGSGAATEETQGSNGTRTTPPSPEREGTTAPAAGLPREVKLQSGDSLWKIAARLYGPNHADAMVARMIELNRIKDPNRLDAGATIKLPPPPAAGSPAPDAAARRGERGPAARAHAPRPSSSNETYLPFEPGPLSFLQGGSGSSGSGSEYVVKPNESLSEIAVRELGSARHMKAIMELNGITDPDKITAGTRLRLPAVQR